MLNSTPDHADPATTARSRRGLSRRAVRIVFACGGLYFGWRWAFGAHGPAWRHALQVLVTMLLLVTVAELVRWLRGRRGGRQPGGFPVRALVGAKLVLVAVALGVEYLLHRWVSADSAQLVVGVGLGVAIAVIGPVLHRRHNRPGAQLRVPVPALDRGDV
ncbi:hypothetical protein KGQ19_03415 [Catenulispora sp. NL8]|uniref:Uncharacterized protein n=1 Tax=Catenulispora pinistramenti TaxID=2705254 RepID=A0ABS5KIS1_9ACTN|nr:hypothetical protein [Catenulispora pinistramenti]MBS2545910.1 hypothetical protein [Catenulispora pinistramenti]